nr:MAM domain-containing glycosylphosphatidylinositol anchor protein 2-like [Danio rerio]|eukprot:XP_021326631.1 MAM domain-containing glycosylphosphatidylinositol anchor protein 2-like [Danio rerio]
MDHKIPQVNYVTVNSVFVNSVTLDSVTVDSVTVNFVTLDSVTVDSVAVNYVTVNSVTVDSVTVNFVTLDSVTVDSVTVNFVTLDSVTVDSVAVNYVTVNSVIVDSVTVNYVTSRREQSRREQSRREQSRREQSRREQSRREQSRREQSRREQSRREQTPPTVRIAHSGHACNVEEERFSERVYTIREGETLELSCLVTGHPRPQIRWTKTAGSVSDRFQDSSVFNETLHISKIQRHQGGRYYCKAENGLGSPAIKSIRVDVYYLDEPVVTVHQSIGEAKEQFYYERTVFLRCVANSNPPVRYSWHRGRDVLSQGSDKGVEIYEPFFTQGETKILKLKNLRPKDYANYSCIASVRNICGIADRKVIFRLTNKTAPASIKLLVEDPIVVNPGQTVSLVCIPTGGEPAPLLSWTSSSGSLPEKSVLKDGTLTLPAVTSADAGAYSCIATNNVGNPAKKTTTIIVRALKNGRFWITPDPYHNDDNIQIGREVKISCQVEATPPEELQFSWLKNGRALRSSERMVITHTDPDISPGNTHLDIIDLKFTDFGTYTCVAALRGGGIAEISIDVNISSTTGELHKHTDMHTL